MSFWEIVSETDQNVFLCTLALQRELSVVKKKKRSCLHNSFVEVAEAPKHKSTLFRKDSKCHTLQRREDDLRYWREQKLLTGKHRQLENTKIKCL